MGRKGKSKKPPKKQSPYKMPPPIPGGEVIHDPSGITYRIGPSIGVGGFGEIYTACDHENAPEEESAYPYVIKIEPYENGPLFVEMHFYLRNYNEKSIYEFMESRGLATLGMPIFYGTGDHTFNEVQLRYIVLKRYGTDIKKIFQKAGAFKASTAFQLGLQMLDVLDYIHSRGYVHADIKGANILMGLKKGEENQTYLLDFGLALRLDPDAEFDPDPKCAHNGTIEYTSRDAHLGEPTMRGDLEILGYNLLHWITGTLPWENDKEKPTKVHRTKKKLMEDARAFIKEDYPFVPDALIEFFEFIATLGPKDNPDHMKCKQIFENYLDSEGKTRSSTFDFTPSENAPSAKPETDRTENGVEKAPSARAASVVIKNGFVEADALEIKNDTDMIAVYSNFTVDEQGRRRSSRTKPVPKPNKNELKTVAKTKVTRANTNQSIKRRRSQTKPAAEKESDYSDDDKPLKNLAKVKEERKRKSDSIGNDNEVKIKKAKEPPTIIDIPRTRSLRNEKKKDDKYINSLK